MSEFISGTSCSGIGYFLPFNFFLMKKLTITKSIVAVMFLLSLPAEAQKAPLKFGNVSADELNMKQYDKEPGASAMVLCDFEVANIDYLAGDFMVKYNRFRRI